MHDKSPRGECNIVSLFLSKTHPLNAFLRHFWSLQPFTEKHVEEWVWNRTRFRKLQFSSVAQSSDSATPWPAAHQASLSITNCRNLLKPRSNESVMPSNHLILCCPLLFLPSVFPSIRVFSNEWVLHISIN